MRVIAGKGFFVCLFCFVFKRKVGFINERKKKRTSAHSGIYGAWDQTYACKSLFTIFIYLFILIESEIEGEQGDGEKNIDHY